MEFRRTNGPLASRPDSLDHQRSGGLRLRCTAEMSRCSGGAYGKQDKWNCGRADVVRERLEFLQLRPCVRAETLRRQSAPTYRQASACRNRVALERRCLRLLDSTGRLRSRSVPVLWE